LLSLAFECGFNSKSTFNRAFKKFKGITPIQFIKNEL
ncbi:MAG: helix-turn-helix domain-containing protein, partial [Bacteroidota bacterium]